MRRLLEKGLEVPGIPLADYGAGNFITQLQTGQAGAMASTLAGVGGTVPYFCNLVGSIFSPVREQCGCGYFQCSWCGISDQLLPG